MLYVGLSGPSGVAHVILHVAWFPNQLTFLWLKRCLSGTQLVGYYCETTGTINLDPLLHRTETNVQYLNTEF